MSCLRPKNILEFLHLVSAEICGTYVRVVVECSARSNRRAQVTREIKPTVSVGSQNEKKREEIRN
jgi:hypothetical protein